MSETVGTTAMWGDKWERTTEPDYIKDRETNIVGGCNYERFYSCYGAKELEQRCWGNAMEHCTRSALLL